MKLKKILGVHEEHTRSGTLHNSLGDGYLVTHNPVYRRVREAVVAMGYEFSSERFHDYEVMALTQLPIILKKKVSTFKQFHVP